ncbi:MAG: DUF6062 family protein [bacterium]|nr:DUF6062 family protein [bacterium]
MKEKLYTIDVNDAWKAGDECPFCYLERKLEQDTLSFVLGSSYMESDIREQTDKTGFCRVHTKKMYDYGNSLGNAWILKTRMQYLNQNLKDRMKSYTPEKKSFFSKFKKAEEIVSLEPVRFIQEQESHCYVCERMDATYQRYLDTFLYMVKQDGEMMEHIRGSKGLCLHHFAEVLEKAEEKLDASVKEKLIPLLYEKMAENLDRIQEDIDWFIEKYDYRNADADWKNSKDAVPRTMQKIVGGYPADPVFKKD